ncbi:MAG: AAA family ATPase, partial [Devosiaceae bacterium]|nr:AAA family ATPase [Devosiaceae bacterium]
MARIKSNFICQSCAAISTQWSGRCDACGEWNTIIEERSESGIGAGPKSAKAGAVSTKLFALSGQSEDAIRIKSQIAELDRVTGGGFVKGSALLVGGDPGIGKSTLLLQAAAKLADQGRRVIYVSGEEAIAQVRLRAKRLGVANSNVQLAAETNVEIILATLEEAGGVDLVIIDSIQTLWTDRVDSAPG